MICESAKPEPKQLIRSGEVLRLTGWSRCYLRKMVACGVVREIRYGPNLHPWYNRKDVEQLTGPL